MKKVEELTKRSKVLAGKAEFLWSLINGKSDFRKKWELPTN